MLNNVKDFRATGDGTSDDREAIQAAIDDAVANNKGGILFPSGTYRVSQAEDEWSLDLNGVQDFMIIGEGPKSVVKLVDTTAATGDWHVFMLRGNCRRVVFKDLVIDGNRTGLVAPDEQSHGIEVEDGTEDLVIDHCILRECFGDGVRIVRRKAVGQAVRRVRITSCLFQTNWRSGLSIQRGIDQLIVANCMFDATVHGQSIEFEPTDFDNMEVPDLAPMNLVIQGCIINHTNRSFAVTLSGIKGADPVVRCKFTDNLVLGSGILCTDVAQLTIQNNVVVVPDRVNVPQHIPVQVKLGSDTVIISGNLVINDSTITEAAISVTETGDRQVTRVLIVNNLCFARFKRGIQCLSGDDVTIQSNMIVATGTCTAGILVESESSAVDGIAVRDNDITTKGSGRWSTGVRIVATAAHQIHHVSVVGNSVRGADEGVVFHGSTFQQTPVCALNRIDAGVASPLLGIENLPEHSMVVGGATSRGGASATSGAGRFITGLGDPNDTITGNVGDIFQRIDGGVGATFYVKELDASPKTGWTAK
jgi:hypothetical protein